MANTAHEDLTGSDLHEPKGIAAAAASTIYVAGGSGSGTFKKITTSEVNTSSLKNVNLVFVTYTIDDISTAASHWMVPGIAGDVKQITSVLHAAITGSDAALTFEIGGVAITNSALTVTQSGSAAGDVDASTPSGAKTITAAQPVEIITDGGSTGTVKCTITLEIDVA